jgi:flagellar protein FliO/FliZ
MKGFIHFLRAASAVPAFVLLAPHCALAQSLPVLNDPLPAAPSSTGILWQTLSSVLVILVLGAVGMVAVKRFLPRLGRPFGGGRTVRVLETVPLGPRRSVHLLQVGGRKILVGDSQNNISMLADITDAYVPGSGGAECHSPEQGRAG